MFVLPDWTAESFLEQKGYAIDTVLAIFSEARSDSEEASCRCLLCCARLWTGGFLLMLDVDDEPSHRSACMHRERTQCSAFVCAVSVRSDSLDIFSRRGLDRPPRVVSLCRSTLLTFGHPCCSSSQSVSQRQTMGELGFDPPLAGLICSCLCTNFPSFHLSLSVTTTKVHSDNLAEVD